MRRYSVVWLVVVLVAATGWAQGPVGLQIAETAGPKPVGQVLWSGGLCIGDDTTFYGVRGALALSEAVQLFCDAGIVDMDDVDEDIGIKVGGLVALPVELPFDAGVRGTYETVFFDDFDYYALSVMGVGSVDAAAYVAGLSLYGGLGLAYWDAEVEGEGVGEWVWVDERGAFRRSSVDSEDDAVEVAFSLGALYDMTGRLSAFAEYSHVDDSFLGLGVRLAL